MKWEMVHDAGPGDLVRRLAIKGRGWLYQVEKYEIDENLPDDGTARRVSISWHPPVFVPDMFAGAT